MGTFTASNILKSRQFDNGNIMRSTPRNCNWKNWKGTENRPAQAASVKFNNRNERLQEPTG
jgi:hypothetical protein